MQIDMLKTKRCRCLATMFHALLNSDVQRSSVSYCEEIGLPLHYCISSGLALPSSELESSAQIYESQAQFPATSRCCCIIVVFRNKQNHAHTSITRKEPNHKLIQCIKPTIRIRTLPLSTIQGDETPSPITNLT